MDTNQETGVSLADVADLLEDDTKQDEQAQEETSEEEVENDQSEAQEEEEGGESEEVEFEGKAYKVPKEIKDALLRQADYTQKTQEVAEQRKAVQAREQSLEQQQRVMMTTFDKAVELKELNNRLSQFEQIDWQGLAQSDPAQATQLHIAYQQLQRQAQVKNGELHQASTQMQQLSEEARQQKLAEGAKYLKTQIPDFSEKVAARIAETAQKTYGITAAELKAISEENPDPRFVHILHDAMKWRSLQADKPKAMQKVAEAPKAITPRAVQPKAKPQKSAEERLRKFGRVEDLAKFF